MNAMLVNVGMLDHGVASLGLPREFPGLAKNNESSGPRH